jgi:transcription elongation factor GreA
MMAEREPGGNARIPITPEGLQRLQAELDELRRQRQPDAAQRVRETREQAADPLESGEFSQAFEELRDVEARISALEEMLGRVELVEAEQEPGLIGLGSSVKLRLDDGSEETYTLVGPSEADPLSGTMSHRSPLGQALLGRRRGQDVSWESPEGTRSAHVLDVRTAHRPSARRRRAG